MVKGWRGKLYDSLSPKVSKSEVVGFSYEKIMLDGRLGEVERMSVSTVVPSQCM
jgi:hypothetical protein